MTLTMQTTETISRKDMIDALVDDKFAVFVAFEYLESNDVEFIYGRSLRGEAKYTEYIAESLTARRRYRAHLNTLSRAELEKPFNKLRSAAPRDRRSMTGSSSMSPSPMRNMSTGRDAPCGQWSRLSSAPRKGCRCCRPPHA